MAESKLSYREQWSKSKYEQCSGRRLTDDEWIKLSAEQAAEPVANRVFHIRQAESEIRGEYLAPAHEDRETLLALGIAHQIWGTGIVEISEWIVERLGMEFTLTQAQELSHEIAEAKTRRDALIEARQVKCDCGHYCDCAQVMSTSRGTSCPDCYDRMSE